MQQLLYTTQKFAELTKLFQDIQQNLIKAVSQIQSQQNRLQARDQSYYVNIPKLSLSSQSDKLSKNEHFIENWVSKMIKNVFSVTFSHYQKQEMTFQSSKIFCSKHIIQNILRYFEANKTIINSSSFFSLVNNSFRQIIKEIKCNFPLNEEARFEIEIQKEVKSWSRDRSEQKQYDFFTHNPNYFKFSLSGNYNQGIMKTINCLIDRVQAKFSSFCDKLHQIYQKIIKQKLQIFNQLSKRHQQQKNLRKSMILLINRKIPEIVQKYSQKQLKRSSNIDIKDKSILRILTKWCSQLKSKYQSYDYFLKLDNFIQVDNEFVFFNVNQKQKLQIEFQSYIQNHKIQDLQQLLSNSSHQLSFQLMKNLINNTLDQQQQEAIQAKSATIAYHLSAHQKQIILIYLNKLIHGLMTASHAFSLNTQDQEQRLQNPNLLTFKPKDLLRAKFSSTPEIILQMLRLIREQFEVIRIKNRLRDENNDILVSFFDNGMICQLQLNIYQEKSRFVECSYKFNHYIYDIQRSIFGPFMEIANIWNSCASHTLFRYQEKIKKKISKNKMHNCDPTLLLQNQSDKDLYQICDNCFLISYGDNYFGRRKKCKQCNFRICSLCQINKLTDEQIKNLFKINFIKKIKQKQMLTEQMIFIKKQSKQKQFKRVLLVTSSGIDYLVQLTFKNTYVVSSIAELSESYVQNILQQYLIFEVKNSFKYYFLKKQIDDMIIKQKIKSVFQKQQFSINLNLRQFSLQSLKKLLYLEDNQFSKLNKNKILALSFDGTQQYLNEKSYFSFWPPSEISVQYLQLIFSKYKQLQKFVLINIKLDHVSISQYIKLEQLQLIETNIKYIQNWKYLSKLKKLIIKGPKANCVYIDSQDKTFYEKDIHISQEITNLTLLNQLSITNFYSLQLPPSIFDQMQNLLELNLSNNGINNQRFPNSISKLKRLVKLDLSRNNSLKYLNLNFADNSNLKKLNLQSCYDLIITQSDIIKYINLQDLNLSHCNLKNKKIDFNQLPQLIFLNLRFTKIVTFPSIQNCFKLRNLNCFENRISSIPDACLAKTQQIQIMALTLDNITFELNGNHLPSLKQIVIGNSICLNLPQIECSTLQSLSIFHCNLRSLPDNFFDKIQNLKYLDLKENQFYEQNCIPKSISKLKKLVTVNLEYCKLKQIPSGLFDCLSLQNILLKYNQIKRLTTSIKKLVKLQFLSIDIQKINDLQTLTKYQIIDISQRQIKQILISNMIIFKTNQTDEQKIKFLKYLFQNFLKWSSVQSEQICKNRFDSFRKIFLQIKYFDEFVFKLIIRIKLQHIRHLRQQIKTSQCQVELINQQLHRAQQQLQFEDQIIQSQIKQNITEFRIAFKNFIQSIMIK